MGMYGNGFDDGCDYTRHHEVEPLKERIKELEEALKPFADFRATWQDEEAKDSHGIVNVGRSGVTYSITMGHLRKAREVLKQPTGSPLGEESK